MSPSGDETSDRPSVVVCTTGKGPQGTGSELEDRLRITARKSEEPKVVMSLGPGDQSFTSMPELAPGDLLRVTTEVEVTTDATRKEDCVGEPYSYHPTVRASLLVASSREASKPDSKHALRVGEPAEHECTHEAHHRVIVFSEDWPVPEKGLPWSGPSYLNLVLEANHREAKDGHVMLIGENERPEGGGRMTVGGDKGRVNAIRFRPGDGTAGERLETSNVRARGGSVPIDETRRVVYSQPVEGLADGEQLAVEAKLKASHPSFPARLSARLFLADSPTQTQNVKDAKEAAALGGEISELNGFNCSGPSCVLEKFGVARITKPPKRDPIYVNLVVVCGDPEKTGRRDPLRVSDGGFLRVVRYPPAPKP